MTEDRTFFKKGSIIDKTYGYSQVEIKHDERAKAIIHERQKKSANFNRIIKDMELKSYDLSKD